MSVRLVKWHLGSRQLPVLLISQILAIEKLFDYDANLLLLEDSPTIYIYYISEESLGCLSQG